MRCLVLGSGVIGTTTAYYLAQEGFEVTVVDRLSAVAQEASYANAGQISPGYASPWAAPGVPFSAIKWLFEKHAPLAIKPTTEIRQYLFMWEMLMNCSSKRYAVNKERLVRLSEYSRDVMDRLRAETGIRYEDRQLGTIQVFRTQEQLDAAAKDMQVLDEMNVPYELLDKATMIKREPALALVQEKLVGALRLPNDQTGDCLIFTQQLQAMAEHLGVTFMFEQQIERLEEDGHRITGVWINGQRHTADHYVVCLGCGAPEVLKSVDIRAPIYPLKGYSITVPIKDAEQAPVSTVLDETYKVAITRFDDRIRVGGMAEIQGNSKSLNPKREETLRMIVGDLFPEGADLSGDVAFWTGLRPKTPDSTPIVGPTKYKNLFINAGHGTLGWTMACGAGQFIAHQVAGKATEISPKGLDISRYS